MKEVLKKIKKKGILFYLKLCFRKLIRTIIPKYQKLFVFEIDLSKYSRELNTKRNITVEIAKNIKEIESFIKEREVWYYNYANALFKKGNLCFIGKINKKIVSCLWTSFNEVYLSDVEYLLHVDREVVPLIDAYTLPEYQNMGIYGIVWNFCIRYFQNKPEYKKIYGFITRSNKRSLLVHKKLKLQRIIIEISLFRIFGIKKHFIKHYIRK